VVVLRRTPTAILMYSLSSRLLELIKRISQAPTTGSKLARKQLMNKLADLSIVLLAVTYQSSRIYLIVITMLTNLL
jgi:hypothetical protein